MRLASLPDASEDITPWGAALSRGGSQALLLGSRAVLGWAACIALAFHLFVLFWEEPDLRRRFGADYEAYCRRVPRWLPRPPRG